ncbi:MAG: Arm DNA-binding domain-containing protein [Cytophagales bacterium]|nr:Arm DNA-binding domain-containing protein [Cytophagales bacterium]
MSSIKVVLRREKRKKDGTYPLALRIIKDRKPKYIHLGQSVDDKHWYENTGKVNKSHPNAVRLNNLILKKLAEANNTAIELDTREEFVSSEEIKNKIKRKGRVKMSPFFNWRQRGLNATKERAHSQYPM